MTPGKVVAAPSIAQANDGPSTATRADTGALVDRHRHYLDERAVPLEIAVRAGLRSVSGAEAAELVGFERPLHCGGLAIPYIDGSTATIHRIRLDEPAKSGARFLGPKGQVFPYLPPHGVQDSAVWRSTDRIFVVEGPVKALALCAAGFPSIGLGGVTAGGHNKAARDKDGALRPHPELVRRVALRGREVVITFDAGRATNANVAWGEAMNAAALQEAGAIVLVAALPVLPDGGDQGPDDFLAAHGEGELRKVVDAAVLADPIARLEAISQRRSRTQRTDEAAALLADLPFLAAVSLGGSVVADRVAHELHRLAGVRKTTFREKVAGFRGELRQKAVSRKPGKSSRRPKLDYAVVDGRICWQRPASDTGAPPVVEPLSNFAAQIVDEVSCDDGVEVIRQYRVEGRLAGGAGLPVATVSAAEFGAMAWVAREWGARAVVGAGYGIRDRLREAIQQLSTPRQRQVFRHTGWRRIEGEWNYLYAGGAVGAGDVSVELPPPLDRFDLTPSAGCLRDAVKMSLRIRECGPPTVTFPLLSATYLAPLASFFNPDFMVWLVGPTGSLKSVLAALGQSHFGDFDRKHLPISWASTDNAIEALLFRLKDALAVIDDYAPGSSHKAQADLQAKGQRVIRGIGNVAGRSRLRADLSSQPDRPPRSLVLSTAEDLPAGASILARLVTVEVDRRQLNLETITVLQENTPALRHAMRGFLEWLRPQLDALRRDLPAIQRAARADLCGIGAHLRQADALAWLYVGIDMLLQFAVEVDAISAPDADVWRTKSLASLRMIADGQGDQQRQYEPTARFMAVLRTLLAQGSVGLAERGASLDFDGREHIGWQDMEHAFLLPEAARRCVVRSLRDSGEHWPHTPSALHAALVRQGLVVPGPDGRPEVQLRVGPKGARHRVLRIPRGFLESEPVPGVSPCLQVAGDAKHDVCDNETEAEGRASHVSQVSKDRDLLLQKEQGS